MTKVRVKDQSTANDEDKKPRLNEAGQEVLDETPVTLPVRFRRGENITDRVRMMVEAEISRRAAHDGYETIDEANDFDVGDDYDPSSDHEVDEHAEAAFYEQQQHERNTGFFKRAPKDARSTNKENAAGGGSDKPTSPSPDQGNSGGKSGDS